jgi:transcription elongation factor Elf1
MSSLILPTIAMKVINKRGGIETRRRAGWGFYRKVSGSDYVVFVCPHCSRRNKRSIHEAISQLPGLAEFKCKICRGRSQVRLEALIESGGNLELAR